MKQLLQSLRDGSIDITEVPCPAPRRGYVTVQSRISLISAGTERMLVEFGKSNLFSKVRSQPDKVKQVLDKIKTDGILPTMNSVFSKLDQPIPLGYANVGVIHETGAGTKEFEIGDRVVSNGSHAEIVQIPENLCAKIPEGVRDEEAAFTVLGAIALQGVRLAEPALGENYVVMGLGVIGLLTVQLLLANGCRVLAMDLDESKLEIARKFGAGTYRIGGENDPVKAGLSFSKGNGVDGVMIAASTKSSEPVHHAAQMCRKRGKIVLVGVTGLELSRADFYEKELTFQVSCSYGPGRYDPAYEQEGKDYPYGFVRWTAQRNFEAFLDLLSRGKIDVKPLIGSIIPFEDAAQAYNEILINKSSLGTLLKYSGTPSISATIKNRIESTTGSKESPVIGVIGTGAFSTGVIIPNLKKNNVRLKTVVSARGMPGAVAGKKFGFEYFTADTETVLNDPGINTVFIATRHNSHARLTTDALEAGKNVFVEKPLALNRDELQAVREIIGRKPELRLMVGFNRRFSPFSGKIKNLVNGRTEPLTAIYTVNAGMLPDDHWTRDPEVGGGRIIGEGCHFIDLLRYVIGQLIVDVRAAAGIDGHRRNAVDDRVTITLIFEDGSQGTVHYFGNGSKKFPKEKLEIFSDGRVLEMVNFRELRGYGFKQFKSFKSWKQKKGHKEEITAFLESVRTGKTSPISWDEMEQVTEATFRAVESIRG